MGRIADISDVLLVLGLSGTVTDEERAIANGALARAEGVVRAYLRYDPAQASRTEYYPVADFGRANNPGVWEVSSSTAVMRRRASAATDELQLKHLPIRGATEPQVFIDYDGRFGKGSGAFAAESEKTIGTDFWPQYDGADDDGDEICRDGILMSIGLWPSTPGSVKVVYTAGYTADEFSGGKALVDASPIYESVLEEAARRAKRALAIWKKTAAGHRPGPLSSESLGDYSYTTDSAFVNKFLGGGVGDLLGESMERLEAFVNRGEI